MRAGMVIEGRFPSLNDYVDAERANRHVGAKMKRRETARAEAAGVLEGDGQRHVVALQDCFEVDPANPRVMVEVVDVDPGR